MKSILEVEQKNLSNKTILVRLDLNVPLKNGKITDTHRIDKIIPTIKFLIENNAKLIIISHIGRPKGKVLKDLSLKPVSENLSKQINIPVKLLKNDIYNLNKENIVNDFEDDIEDDLTGSAAYRQTAKHARNTHETRPRRAPRCGCLRQGFVIKNDVIEICN